MSHNVWSRMGNNQPNKGYKWETGSESYLLKGTEPCQDKETRHKCSGLGVDNDLTIGLNYRKGNPIGVNISERKSGTEPKKKRKKRELVCFPTARGCNEVHRL